MGARPGFPRTAPPARHAKRCVPFLVPRWPVSRVWSREPACWFFLGKAEEATATGNDDIRADYAECRAYWLDDFANLSEKTRSVITLMFTKLAQPFTTQPLRKLHCTDITLRPEDTFDGKIIIIAPSTLEYRLVGRITALTWKYCWQVA